MLFIGSDHRGYETKEAIKKYLQEKEIDFTDCGTNSNENADYPIFAKEVCSNVKQHGANKGILICGTGIGMSIVANKFKGIRCALCYDEESAKYSRLHNNSNILALKANNTTLEKNIKIVEEWLNTEFEGERHKKRIEMIEKIEKENFI